ncbi:MAG: hypothetical protein O3B08_00875 [Proteobacteria bacterium]|nr:hypothetical protein [Pseudomonadota bacterium]
MKTIIGLLFSSFVILLSAASVNAETYQLNEKQLQTLFAHGLAFSFDGRNSRLNFRFKSDGKWYADTSASDEAWGKWWIDGDRFCNSLDGPDRGWSKLREQDDCATFSIIGDNLNWSKFPKNVDLDDRSVLVRLKPEPAQPVQTATRSLDTEFVALSGGEIRALFAGGISFAWDGKDSAVIFTYRDNGKWTVAKPGGDENWGTWEIRGDQHCRSVDGPEIGWRGMRSRPTCNPVFRKGRQLFYGETHESIRPLDAATVLARIMPAEPPTVPVQTATVSSASSEALAREQAIFRQQAELERQRIEAQKRELEMMRLALEKERLQQEQLALQRQQQALQAAVTPPATAPAAPSADTAPPEIRAEAALETRSESLTISGTASDDRKLTRVEVEGREVAFRGRDGGFTANVTVQIGQNRIRIAAFDAEGNKSEHIVLVTRQRDIPPVEFGRFHALVIGNNNYDTLPKLNTAVSDARAVAKILTEQ